MAFRTFNNVFVSIGLQHASSACSEKHQVIALEATNLRVCWTVFLQATESPVLLFAIADPKAAVSNWQECYIHTLNIKSI
jgi:hypothetical protein